MMKILIVVGTRPNFIKITQFKKLIPEFPGFEVKIVHTGQHYDDKMSDVFFKQLNIKPDYYLSIPKGSPVQQMADIMVRLEKLILDSYRPDLMIVPGDVNTTLAAAIVANKMNIRLAHLEAGLRSFDRSMPEESNRILTDAVSDLFFVTEQSGVENLREEGVPAEKIFLVGNTMIDTLVAFSGEIDSSDVLDKLKLKKGHYVLMTIHRPSTVDTQDGLEKLLDVISRITAQLPVVFPVHPRTVNSLEKFGLYNRLKSCKQLTLCEPLDYFSFQKLIKNALLILTDSGGIQEETTYLRIPCLTLRSNTERPVTVQIGTNELIPFETNEILSRILKVQSGTNKQGSIPPLWDGKSTERVLKTLQKKSL